MKTVLLTGARGFIGAHCLEALLKRGFMVHAVSSRGRQNSYPEQVEWHHADLHNGEHLFRLMAEVRPQYLLHMAWDVAHGTYWTSLENLRWVKSSLSLLQAFIDYGGQRAVMAGSCAEYDWSYGYCTEKKTPLNPGTLYGICKSSLWSMAEAACLASGISTAWGRLFFLFGPGEHPNRLVSSVIISLLKGEDALCTHGEQIRDYIYVKDAASALVALLDSKVEGPVNIASGRPVLLKDIVGAAAHIIGRPQQVRLGAMATSKDDPALLLANTKRLNEEVCWAPNYTMHEGLIESVEWWRKSGGKFSGTF